MAMVEPSAAYYLDDNSRCGTCVKNYCSATRVEDQYAELPYYDGPQSGDHSPTDMDSPQLHDAPYMPNGVARKRHAMLQKKNADKEGNKKDEYDEYLEEYERGVEDEDDEGEVTPGGEGEPPKKKRDWVGANRHPLLREKIAGKYDLSEGENKKELLRQLIEIEKQKLLQQANGSTTVLNPAAGCGPCKTRAEKLSEAATTATTPRGSRLPPGTIVGAAVIPTAVGTGVGAGLLTSLDTRPSVSPAAAAVIKRKATNRTPAAAAAAVVGATRVGVNGGVSEAMTCKEKTKDAEMAMYIVMAVLAIAFFSLIGYFAYTKMHPTTTIKTTRVTPRGISEAKFEAKSSPQGRKVSFEVESEKEVRPTNPMDELKQSLEELKQEIGEAASRSRLTTPSSSLGSRTSSLSSGRRSN